MRCWRSAALSTTPSKCCPWRWVASGFPGMSFFFLALSVLGSCSSCTRTLSLSNSGKGQKFVMDLMRKSSAAKMSGRCFLLASTLSSRAYPSAVPLGGHFMAHPGGHSEGTQWLRCCLSEPGRLYLVTKQALWSLHTSLCHYKDMG